MVPAQVMSEPVHNTHEQVGLGGVYISYHAASGRSVIPNRAVVVRVGYKTCPNAAWYDYGNKTFVGNRSASVPLAQEWASKRYGINMWRKNGVGDWVDAAAVLPPLLCEIERKAKRAAKRAAKMSEKDAAE
jgi:hypothetical protein